MNNRELELLNILRKQSIELNQKANFNNISYKESMALRKKQDEIYRKWKFLKEYRKAKEKLK